MKFIACIDRFGGLGYRGKLLFHIHKDMKRFKEYTTGGVVVMGYTTYESLPHGALPNRLNIVMSRNHTVDDENVVVVNSHEMLFDYLKEHNINPDDVWIIGGESLYVDFLPECKEIFLTRVEALEVSDRFFPCPETISGWGVVSIEHDSENGLNFDYEHYARRQKK